MNNEILEFIYNYFYKIDCSINGMYYYGVHGTNNLEDKYMGSSKNVNKDIALFGQNNFNKQNLVFFNNFKNALEYEKLIVDASMLNDPSCYNKSLGGNGGWRHTIGSTVVIDNDGHKFRINVNDERFINKELKSISLNKCSYKDSNGKMYYLNTDDKLIYELNLKSNITDKVICKDKNGNCFFVNLDDERYLSGELVHLWTGLKHKKESIEKIKNTMLIKKHQQGEKNSQFGTCWVYNDNLKQNKKIKKENLDNYLNLGWKKGKLDLYNKKINNCYIYNDNLKQVKCINKNDLDNYLNLGWKKGRKNEYLNKK